VVDVSGDLVTLQVTYLEVNGRKLSNRAPRKILSPLTEREGCAVRLMPLDGETLGIAEGIETALSAASIHRMPVWAALSTTLLGKFEPPSGVSALHIYADRDAPGLEAADSLMARMQGKVRCELHLPPPPHNDFNDALLSREPSEGSIDVR
jgi:hypothetical protein